jgi:hypothetical protein
MLAKISGEHQHDWDLHKLGWLKLAGDGQLDPTTLTVDLHSYAGNQHDHQQYQTKDVKSRGQLDDPAIIAEGNRHHRDHGDAQTDELLFASMFPSVGRCEFPTRQI